MKITFLVLIAGLLTAGAIFFAKNNAYQLNQPQLPQAWTDELRLAYANTLLSKGLPRQAAEALEDYITNTSINKKDLAAVCYKLGNIYMDLNEYENALKGFYKAELLEPGLEGKEEMDRRIVEALEHLGLSQQAQYELEARTSINQPAEKGANVVARIGKREILQAEIDRALNNLPQWAKEEVDTKEGRLKFLQQYVAGEVLYEKAKKLGLDRSAKLREALSEAKKEFMLQELMKNEIDKNLKITPQDVELYYKANKGQYSVSEKIKVSYLESADGAKEEDVAAQLKQGKGKKIDEWIEKTSFYIPELGQAKEALDNLFKIEKGGVSGPLKIKEKNYLFLIDDKEAEKEILFEEVKDTVENEYRMQKQQEIINSLLKNALEQQEVEILGESEKKDEKPEK